MTLSALSKKIEKVENEINKHQEIISDKKKELAELKSSSVHYSYRRNRSEERISFLLWKKNLERKSQKKCSINFLLWQMKVQQFHMKTNLKLFMKV